MAGKKPKNPLLSGAGINFPFENFTHSALLVPVPQNERPLIPEGIETDSFLGQEPQRSVSGGVKLLPAAVSKSHFSTSHLEPSLSSPFVSEPQHQALPTRSPIPEFTKSFTGAPETAKPTPLYPDALSHQFTQSLGLQSQQSHDQKCPQPILATEPSNYILQPPLQASAVYSTQSLNSSVPYVLPPASNNHGTSFNYFPPAHLTSAPTKSANSTSPLLASVPPTSNSSYFSTQTVTPTTLSQNHPSQTIFTPVSDNTSDHSFPSHLTPTYEHVFPTILTPPQVVAPSNLSQSVFTSSQNTASSNKVPSVFTPATITTQSNQFYSNFTPHQAQSSSVDPASIFTTIPVTTPYNLPSSIFTPPQASNLSSSSIFTPEPAINAQQSSLSILAPASISDTPLVQSTQISTSELQNCQSQSFFSYFSQPEQQNQANIVSTSLDSGSHPSPAQPPSSATLFATPIDFLSTSSSLTNPPPLSSGTKPTVPQPSQSQPPLPPLLPPGGAPNLYRRSNNKRPTYTRPPELSVTPMAAMPTPLAPAAQTNTLFTPMSASSTSVDGGGASTTGSMPSRPAQVPTPATEPTVVPPSFASLAQGNTYRPVYHHWFFKKIVEGKIIWNPFSMNDSLALEEAFTSATISPDTRVPTDGGRYDVDLLRRRRTAIYWQEDPGDVRRCSWFVKGSMDVRYMPYEENIANMLEEEYKIACSTNEWNRHVSLPDGEVIVIHSPNAIAHHTRSTSPDVWGNSPQMQQKPRVVKRGMDEFDISEGEPEKVDHLLFLVHGIGKFCDLKFRPVTEVVDDFRSMTLQLLQSHFKEGVMAGHVGRIEVLPVSWHQALHSAHIDARLHNITLRSIPRLRHFTNDTLLDILFYTSPVFCETIVQAVGNELNRLHNLFLSRNPSFAGGVSLGGHSLGSLILFDMLCNQVPAKEPTPEPMSSSATSNQDGTEEMDALGCMKAQKAVLSRSVSYLTIGTAGTGQPYISYPQLVFQPTAFFALGSPIGMFVTVRGVESLGEDFALPTCSMFFNVFHPFDPVAYRIESLLNPEFSKYSPVLIAHHKGRKRMHLELKDTLEHVGTALKQRLVESMRSTWNAVYQSMFYKTDDHTIEQEVNKVIEKEILNSCEGERESDTTDGSAIAGPEVTMGQLNGGRRVDYVLQEAPLESFNEYLFALSSHVCYWESEDTMLMILKEIYGTMGVSPDSQVVQQILLFEPTEAASQYALTPTTPPATPTFRE